MADEIRRVWRPTPVIVMVGETEYTVVPRPAQEILKVQDRLERLAADAQLMLGATGEDDSESEGKEKKATLSPFRQLAGAALDAPYDLLKIAIPDLKKRDATKAPIPQLLDVFNVVIDVNGLNWLRDVVKNFMGPLAPAASALVAQAMLDFSQRAVPTESTPGETESTV